MLAAVATLVVTLAGPASAGIAPRPAALPDTVEHIEQLPSALWMPGTGQAYRLTYWSTGSQHEPVLVHGAVFIPPGPVPRGGWPVLSWEHGTVGLAAHCAPSAAGYPTHVRDYLAAWLRKHYVIMATDYVINRTSGVHPYLDGSTAARKPSTWSAPLGTSSTICGRTGWRSATPMADTPPCSPPPSPPATRTSCATVARWPWPLPPATPAVVTGEAPLPRAPARRARPRHGDRAAATRARVEGRGHAAGRGRGAGRRRRLRHPGRDARAPNPASRCCSNSKQTVTPTHHQGASASPSCLKSVLAAPLLLLTNRSLGPQRYGCLLARSRPCAPWGSAARPGRSGGRPDTPSDLVAPVVVAVGQPRPARPPSSPHPAPRGKPYALLATTVPGCSPPATAAALRHGGRLAPLGGAARKAYGNAFIERVS